MGLATVLLSIQGSQCQRSIDVEGSNPKILMPDMELEEGSRKNGGLFEKKGTAWGSGPKRQTSNCARESTAEVCSSNNMILMSILRYPRKQIYWEPRTIMMLITQTSALHPTSHCINPVSSHCLVHLILHSRWITSRSPKPKPRK